MGKRFRAFFFLLLLVVLIFASWRFWLGHKKGEFVDLGPPSSSLPLVFVVYGDSRNGSALPDREPIHKSVVDLIESIKPDLVLHIGDFVWSCERGWDSFDRATGFDPLTKTIRGGIPFYPITGNHEYRRQGDPLLSCEDTQPYRDYFASYPNEGVNYSFDVGGVHFVAIDTTRADGPGGNPPDFRKETAVYEWLENDLSASAARWKVVFLHHAPFSCSDHGPTPMVREHLVSLFEEHGVDLVLAGHDHSYQRFYPIKRGVRDDEDGIVYIVSAGGGAALYAVKTVGCVDGDKLAQSSESTSDYHVTKIEVKDDVLCGQTIGFKNKILDEFSVPFGQMEKCGGRSY